VFWRRKPALTDDQVRELVKSVRHLREDIDDLAHKHERLRGKFYGNRNAVRSEDLGTADNPSGEAGSSGSARRPSKSELLARYFTPGKPTIHSGG